MICRKMMLNNTKPLKKKIYMKKHRQKSWIEAIKKIKDVKKKTMKLMYLNGCLSLNVIFVCFLRVFFCGKNAIFNFRCIYFSVETLFYTLMVMKTICSHKYDAQYRFLYEILFYFRIQIITTKKNNK